MNYREGLYLVPNHMHDAVINYIEKGWEPGSFLQAVIENDLSGAASRADLANQKCLFEWAQYFYGYAPRTAWGSPQAYDRWVKHKGLEGLEQLAQNWLKANGSSF